MSSGGIRAAREELVGRERHIRELAMLVDGVSDARGGTLLLSGEAGAGRTRVAEEAADRGIGAGHRVAWVTCSSPAAAPLSLCSDLLGALDASTTISVDAVRAVADDSDPDTARAILVRELVVSLRQLCAGSPTLLVIDDLQWSDPLSLRVVQSLAAGLRTTALGVIVTWRQSSDVPSNELLELSRSGRHLVVPPMTAAELDELALRVVGSRLPAAALSRLHERTGGNVLFAR